MSQFSVGQKVACINDTFDPEIAKLYTALPKKDLVYVIRDIRLGIRMLPKPEGDVSLLLVGLVNPRAESKAALERGFSADRFRPLDQLPPKKELEPEQFKGPARIVAPAQPRKEEVFA